CLWTRAGAGGYACERRSCAERYPHAELISRRTAPHWEGPCRRAGSSFAAIAHRFRPAAAHAESSAAREPGIRSACAAHFRGSSRPERLQRPAADRLLPGAAAQAAIARRSTLRHVRSTQSDRLGLQHELAGNSWLYCTWTTGGCLSPPRRSKLLHHS